MAWDERELEAEHLRGKVPDGDDPELVGGAIPQEHVAAVGAEERRRILDDRGEDRVEVERLRDASGGREQAVELIGQVAYGGCLPGTADWWFVTTILP